jgi:hypothetical protein
MDAATAAGLPAAKLSADYSPYCLLAGASQGRVLRL